MQAVQKQITTHLMSESQIDSSLSDLQDLYDLVRTATNMIRNRNQTIESYREKRIFPTLIRKNQRQNHITRKAIMRLNSRIQNILRKLQAHTTMCIEKTY